MKLMNRDIWMLATALSVICASSSPMYGQFVVGQPAVAKTTTTLTTDGVSWDASQFTGADLCAKVKAAWNAAITAGLTGATIDARGLTGAQSCMASPFPSSGSAGKLLLGNTVITTFVTWQIPSRVHVEGIGVSGLLLNTTANTIIRAGSGLTGAVVQLGTGNIEFDVQLKSLTVDGAGIANIGILNNSAEEGSTVEDVNIFNVLGAGLEITAQSSANSPGNSGPYRNINIQFDSSVCSGCAGATGLAITALTTAGTPLSGIRGIDNVTVSGSGGNQQNPQEFAYCMEIIGLQVLITNSHVEYCGVGIQIGGPVGAFPATFNVGVQNVSTFPGSGTRWNIEIENAANVSLSGVLAYSTDVLQDLVTGNTITSTLMAPYHLGWYMLGDGSGSSPAVISSTAGLSTGWVAPGNLDVVSGLTSTTLNVTGSKHFKIDDPIDPANKYLYHSVVESPDRKNVYDGSVTTDSHGVATVTLPDYFDALNKDFRYQLTVLGTFAQATVMRKIVNNRFFIRTSKPNVEVSWQVTGIRRDAYAEAHPLQVEEQKPLMEQGHYLHPELYGTVGRQGTTDNGPRN